MKFESGSRSRMKGWNGPRTYPLQLEDFPSGGEDGRPKVIPSSKRKR